MVGNSVVVLSGLSLAEIERDKTGLLARSVGSKERTLCIFVEHLGNNSFFTANLSRNGDKPPLSFNEIQQLWQQLKTIGPIYLTIDTYLALVLQTKVLPAELISGVFPWQAGEPCKYVPYISSYGDIITRNTAIYYWQLKNHPVQDWEGRIRTFNYKAANTISFRSYAFYHNLERGLRAKIQPAYPGHYTLQFDWSAAEWNLILQYLGYSPPEDAYSTFLEAGLDRELTKKTVLAYIYGAMVETLYKNANGDILSVDKVLKRLDEIYPKVNEWRDQCIANRIGEFNGFRYDLGDVEYVRPNHFAQTALQLCKWELMSRLTYAGVSNLGCGDLHDQLYFDVDPKNPEPIIEVIKQIKQPLFGKYNLRPKFKEPSVSWG